METAPHASSLTGSRPGADGDAGFPFSAVVGQERLQLALILCAVHPGIGGVLVRGEKGTAKSTVVRALAQLLPPVVDETGARPARLVELPVGATEDRVVGSLDLERVLRDGEQAFRPGLLAAAHHGVLYVDEVNLLHDHLVDVLLDAAAMGRVHIERDGVSHSHPARFVLVGTMNPEEGELRPQLLDRFGLTVDVAASRNVDVRMAVVRRRLDYEADPDGFAGRYAAADRAVAERILTARDRVGEVALDNVELRRIAALCASFDVDGMRADLVVARTATAHAAWRGASAVAEEDVRIAAELALPHRRRRDPFDEPGISEEQLDEAMRAAGEEAARESESSGESDEFGTDSPGRSRPNADQGPEDDPDGNGPDSGGPGGGSPKDGPDKVGPDNRGPADGSANDSPPDNGGSSDGPGDGGPDDRGPDSPNGGGRPAREGRTAAPATSVVTPPRWEVPGVGEGAAGRRSRAQTRQGRTVRSSTDTASGLHLLGTVFAAAPHQRSRGRTDGPLKLAADDLRGAYREGREGNLVVFVVDASGSMAARDRLAAVTGAVVALLRDAYQRRDKVAVITVRGQEAELVLPPTSSVDIAVRRLSGIRTGGKTPLAAGLLKAREVVHRERVRDPRRRPMLVLLTDGRATGGVDPVPRARTAANLLANEAITSIVVDCERGMIRLGLAADLARTLRAGYLQLGELTGDSVADIVRAGSGRVNATRAA
ncbi:magnesium chelatase subunit D family protein [Nocardia sp. NBC_00565]|uniref:magnesium chelatase subunit D family protein n=1 Tax=Nocardia sp. NBC_00565 TaxID=2975993 RepID=UPI002E815856|nr:magnesium chelatase subunit D family protein [Nocardia sp. NBC_00565]WUC07990.1 magnesium chelatase subunit D family protein [Nocardia sp. NBC_00565]